MGILDDRSRSYQGSTSRGYSPARSSGGTRGSNTRPTYARSSSSFFGGGRREGASRSPWFGSSKSSYYSRRPRDGYVQYLIHKLRRMLRDLWYYARRHPMKAFFAVIVPLLSAGGAIGGLMRQFGFRLGGGGRRGHGFGGSRGANDWGSSLGSLMQVARAFI